MKSPPAIAPPRRAVIPIEGSFQRIPPPTPRRPRFDEQEDITVDVDGIVAPTVHRSNKRQHRRELRDMRRLKTAAAALNGFDRETRIYGFTKGQFSLIQLVTAALAVTGPADLTLSTWTAANSDVNEFAEFFASGLVRSARWLVDYTFSKRSPQLAKRFLDVFGADAIRVARNHSKWVLIGNDVWRVVIHTSMNLNHNPRFENFEICHDPDLFAFHEEIANEIWKKQSRRLAAMRTAAIDAHFKRDL